MWATQLAMTAGASMRQVAYAGAAGRSGGGSGQAAVGLAQRRWRNAQAGVGDAKRRLKRPATRQAPAPLKGAAELGLARLAGG